MFPDRGDLVSSRPTSRQPSATRSDVRQHGRSDSTHSGLARHDEHHSVTADGGAPRAPTEHDPSSNESEDEEEKRQTRLTRANTLSKDYTEKEELAVIKKFDRKLVLFLAFLYLLSFLDRSSTHLHPRNMATSDRTQTLAMQGSRDWSKRYSSQMFSSTIVWLPSISPTSPLSG